MNSDAYYQGRYAAQNGDEESDNPYTPGTDAYDSWDKGYHDWTGD